MNDDLEAYIRGDDHILMIQIKPGWFVNEQIWRKLGGGDRKPDHRLHGATDVARTVAPDDSVAGVVNVAP